ncbi:hypothetical protein FOA52_010449 [Chlamydomonas sp. UWO 241]|nr:hypothetical protein FOA52_010449 [Chlamydomonas sp. UWO 241]
MPPRRVARQAASQRAADEAAVAAHATAVANEVLFSLDLWAQQLWRWLDRDAKVALRSVSQAMRSQVDGSIQVVVSPSAGCSSDELALTLTRWPCVRHLTRLNVSGASDLAPLSTASLAGLASLTVREAAHAEAWDMQVPNSTAAVTLRVVNLSGCVGLRSIDAISSCVELRCLWMPGCVSVTDLSLLAACSKTLEELWMAGKPGVRSLVPLRACTKLRKLDVRGCYEMLLNEVADLQLTCTQLATPSSVQCEGLVHDLQPSIAPDMQGHAALRLVRLCRVGGIEAQDAMVAAGAIPTLVRLLEPESSEGMQAAAADVLGNLACHAQNKAAITSAGATPALVRLLGPESSQDVHETASFALRCLACDNSGNQAVISAAGAIPALVRLLRLDLGLD